MKRRNFLKLAGIAVFAPTKLINTSSICGWNSYIVKHLTLNEVQKEILKKSHSKVDNWFLFEGRKIFYALNHLTHQRKKNEEEM